jgi:hypothetical protein
MAAGSSDEPSSFVNIELYQTIVSHFQQKGLARLLVRDIGAFHDFVDFEWLLAQRAQDIRQDHVAARRGRRRGAGREPGSAHRRRCPHARDVAVEVSGPIASSGGVLRGPLF